MTTLHNILSSILYTLNSQIWGKNDPTVAECFLGPSGKVQCHGPLERCYVRSMEEPDPGIHQRSQDCVCDFPQGAEKPLWTPERLTQPVERGRRASKVSPEATPCSLELLWQKQLVTEIKEAAWKAGIVKTWLRGTSSG